MIDVANEVRTALADGSPVVALESSIIAHGLPYPANLETAIDLEDAVRDAGAVPATVAIIGGVATVGVTRSGLELLADPSREHAKAGSRDLSVLTQGDASAGTTVSATCALASRAGIRVFATGGIGGVHRGDTGDVSSDLRALATNPIAVVCSGPKSILDLPRTSEMLETLGVPVIGFCCQTLPAFYSRSSSVELEHTVESAAAAAAICAAHFELFERAGALIVNPVPEAAAIAAAELESVVELALEAANRVGVSGKALTPFLLGELRVALGERAIHCNQALVISNACLAAAIARQLSAD